MTKTDPSDAYLAQQPADERALLATLRTLVRKGVPGAEVTMKWGVPCYSTNGKLVCALAAFKEHVGLNFFAPPIVFVDPKKKLGGGGKTSRMLKVSSAADVDAVSIARWLKAVVASKA